MLRYAFDAPAMVKAGVQDLTPEMTADYLRKLVAAWLPAASTTPADPGAAEVAPAPPPAVAEARPAGAASFSDEQAAKGLTVTDELRAVFQCPGAASSAVAVAAAQAPELWSVTPPELLSIILSQLGTRALACLAATCRSLWCEVPNHSSPLPTPGLVETELRRRAEAHGLHISSSLPEGALPWVPYLLKRELRDAQRREAPLAAGRAHSIFVDRDGRLHLACPRAEIKANKVGEPLLGHDWGSDAGDSVPPTLVPSMQGKRIVSVASGGDHCLALSAEGEVYSWGDNLFSALGHADGKPRAALSRIETLAHVESIAAGPEHTSAAVDDSGRLFTWGCARVLLMKMSLYTHLLV